MLSKLYSQPLAPVKFDCATTTVNGDAKTIVAKLKRHMDDYTTNELAVISNMTPGQAEHAVLRLWSTKITIRGSFPISYCGIPCMEIVAEHGRFKLLPLKSQTHIWHASSLRSRAPDGLQDSKAFTTELMAREWFRNGNDPIVMSLSTDTLEGVCRGLMMMYPQLDAIEVVLSDLLAVEECTDENDNLMSELGRQIKTQLHTRTFRKKEEKLSVVDLWGNHPVIYIKA